jgi:acetyl-CoA synthetase
MVVKRCGNPINMVEGRDVWWKDAWEGAPNTTRQRPSIPSTRSSSSIPRDRPASPRACCTRAPATCSGRNSARHYVFDLKENDRYFCSADIGWITGHSYVVYGLLSNGATIFLYEGAPNHPEPDRFWQMIDRHGITILYTAPTAIRAFMRWGDNYVLRHRLDSLRLLGSVGEPINPEAWMWYHTLIGKKRCPIVDTWWQTETGSIMITPLPGVTPTKPGSGTRPFFGVVAKVVDEKGRRSPAQLRRQARHHPALAVHAAHAVGRRRPLRAPVLQRVPGRPDMYFTGDGARQDKDGYFWIVGRIDDVLNVSGHRIGTAEIESALVSHPAVAEAAAVGRPDELKGQSLWCVRHPQGRSRRPATRSRRSLRNHVGKEIGSLAKPDMVRFAAGLPKTRSGKIMRRILKEIAAPAAK